MRFRSFKGFGIGKAKDPLEGRGKESAAGEDLILADENGSEDDLTKKIQDLAGEVNGKLEGPHPPLGELSIELGDESEEDITEVIPAEPKDDGAEDVKLVELKLADDTTPPGQETASGLKPEPKHEAKPPADTGDTGSLSGLFASDEEEENPLANLIKSLPDYNASEIVEDLNEIKRIIHEWQRG